MHGNTKELTGKVFGKLTVLQQAESDKNGHARWLCRCECGKTKIIAGSNLTRGATLSCGCLHKERARATKHWIDISGRKFGRLTAVEFKEVNKNGDAMWHCICDCGKESIVKYSHLMSGAVASCGCAVREAHSHGHTMNGVKPRIYGIWAGMKQRCTNQNRKKYPRYGGRGIKVCSEWLNDFQNFYEWAMENGYQDDLTIDRIDNDGDYEPGNCRWVTSEENTRKRWESGR